MDGQEIGTLGGRTYAGMPRFIGIRARSNRFRRDSLQNPRSMRGDLDGADLISTNPAVRSKREFCGRFRTGPSSFRSLSLQRGACSANRARRNNRQTALRPKISFGHYHPLPGLGSQLASLSAKVILSGSPDEGLVELNKRILRAV